MAATQHMFDAPTLESTLQDHRCGRLSALATRCLALVFAARALAACSNEARRVEAAPIVGGGVLADMVANRDSAIVLFYAPDEPLACFDELARWLEVRRTGSVPVLIVLTARPDDAQRLRLRLARIPVDGVLDRSKPVSTGGPVGALFVHGRLRSSAGGNLVPVASLLERLAPDVGSPTTANQGLS